LISRTTYRPPAFLIFLLMQTEQTAIAQHELQSGDPAFHIQRSGTPSTRMARGLNSARSASVLSWPGLGSRHRMEGTPCFTPVDRLDEWSFVWITAGVVILVYSLLHLFNVVSRHDEYGFAHRAFSFPLSFFNRPRRTFSRKPDARYLAEFDHSSEMRRQNQLRTAMLRTQIP